MNLGNRVFGNLPDEALLAGTSRGERLARLLESPTGDDLRAIFTEVAQEYLVAVKKGDPHAHEALNALDKVVAVFDMQIAIGTGMLAELVRRQSEASEKNGNNERKIDLEAADSIFTD